MEVDTVLETLDTTNRFQLIAWLLWLVLKREEEQFILLVKISEMILKIQSLDVELEILLDTLN
jgi:hypothetical protein